MKKLILDAFQGVPKVLFLHKNRFMVKVRIDFNPFQFLNSRKASRYNEYLQIIYMIQKKLFVFNKK